MRRATVAAHPHSRARARQALQAMRSTRAIQNAWRARRNPGGERDGAPGSSQGGRGEEGTGPRPRPVLTIPIWKYYTIPYHTMLYLLYYTVLY